MLREIPKKEPVNLTSFFAPVPHALILGADLHAWCEAYGVAMGDRPALARALLSIPGVEVGQIRIGDVRNPNAKLKPEFVRGFSGLMFALDEDIRIFCKLYRCGEGWTFIPDAATEGNNR